MNTDHDPPVDADNDDLLGAWALDALDAEETAAVERLLAADPDARREADRLQGAVDDLVEAGAVTPPADLWNRIEAELAPRATGGEEIIVGTGGTSVRMDSTRMDPADELGARRDQRAGRRRWRWAGAGAAAAALVLVAGFGLGRANDGATTTDVAQQLRTEATRLSEQDAARTAVLTGPDGGTVRVVAGPEGRAVLEADLPPMSDQRTYQLWSIDGPEPVSLGLLGPDPDVVLVGTGTATQLAVSAEPAQGSTAPTTTPVVSGRLV